MMNNVWRVDDKRFAYYLRHPLRFLKDKLRVCKWAWQRTTRGFSDVDWWNMNDWLSDVLSNMLEVYAEKSVGYPGESRGFTPEQWQSYLLEIVAHLRNCKEDMVDALNQYTDEWYQILVKKRLRSVSDESGSVLFVDEPLTEDEEELRKKYVERLEEISDWQREEADKGFSMIGKVYFSLWD